jgi:hypothetical protein
MTASIFFIPIHLPVLWARGDMEERHRPDLTPLMQRACQDEKLGLPAPKPLLVMNI